MAADAKTKDDKKVLLRNKKARHDFFVEWTVEAGLALQGSEVKSLREARGVISDAYAMVRNGEAWLVNMQVTEYPWANRWNHEPKRDRKLLLHRREIKKLDEATAEQGYTILPLEIYLKRGLDLALRVLALLVLALVVLLLALADAELDLDAPVLEVHLERQESVALGGGRGVELLDLAPMQEQLAIALGLVVPAVGPGILGHLHVDQPGLAVAHHRVGVAHDGARLA